MTKIELLNALKRDTEEALKGLTLPVRLQKSDEEPPEPRAPAVYLMRIPDGKSATKMAPYVLHQVITGKDEEPTGEHWQGQAVVRTIVCVYHPDEQVGGLAVLDVLERLRIRLCNCPVLDRRFKLDTNEGIEMLIYTEDTAPYYAGEMVTTWWLPPAGKPVKPWLHESDWSVSQ